MANIYTDITELVGRTPLLEPRGFMESAGEVVGRILLKLELFNPAGSVKDRVARAMILDAEEKGILKKGSVIVEPTSGNTGIGLAAIAASRGYRVILTMPSTMSIERRKLLLAYGAELILTDGSKGMSGAIEKAKEICSQTEGAFLAGQFDNPQNPMAHYKSTGPEIFKDTDGRVDWLVAGVGTGGTISGTGKYLKEQRSDIKIVAVEPAASQVLAGAAPGKHGLQGIGAGFIPEVLDTNIYDEIIPVTESEAYAAMKLLAVTEGILCGVSSGAALHAAVAVARRAEAAGKTIVVILPDTGERYLSIEC